MTALFSVSMILLLKVTSDTNVNISHNNNILSPFHKSKGFNLAHLNIRSLPQKLDQLRLLMQDKIIDILSLNETFLDEHLKNDDVHINGYVIYRKDRGSRHGGGVALYL